MPDTRGAVALTTNYQLDKAKHGSPELHKFGQSLLDPTFVSPIPYSVTASAVGQSDEVCRADHIHGLSQEAYDKLTLPMFRFKQIEPTLNASGEAAINYDTPFPVSITNIAIMLTNPLAQFQSGAILGFYNGDLNGFVLKVVKHDGTSWGAVGIFVQYLSIGT